VSSSWLPSAIIRLAVFPIWFAETPRCSLADPKWLFGWPGIAGGAKTRVKHEAREEVFALDPDLRKKAK
jgi:hypothetical protein